MWCTLTDAVATHALQNSQQVAQLKGSELDLWRSQIASLQAQLDAQARAHCSTRTRT